MTFLCQFASAFAWLMALRASCSERHAEFAVCVGCYLAAKIVKWVFTH